MKRFFKAILLLLLLLLLLIVTISGCGTNATTDANRWLRIKNTAWSDYIEADAYYNFNMNLTKLGK